MERNVRFAVSGLLLLALAQAHATRSLKGSSVAREAPCGHGLVDSPLAMVAHRAALRALRQVGDAGWANTADYQPRDYNLLSRGYQAPYSAQVHNANMQMAAGYRGSAAAAQAFEVGGYGGYGASPYGAQDPFYGSGGLRSQPWDAAAGLARANAVSARMNSFTPFDI